MPRATTITRLRGRRVWDSRGLPALEAEVTLAGGAVATATAPSAALPAPGEARDLRDGGAAFGGADVMRMLAAIDGEIARTLVGRDAGEQEAVDRILMGLDAGPDRSRIGGPPLYAVSLATAKAAAEAEQVPLWQHLVRGGRPAHLPLPRVGLLDCGITRAAGNDVVAVSLVPVGAADVPGALDWAAETTRAAARLIEERTHGAAVAGPRGALRLHGATAEGAIELALRAIERAGFSPGEDLALAVDVRAWRYGALGRYRVGDDGRETDTAGLIARYLGWLGRYPVSAVVDPLAGDEIAGFTALADAAGRAVEIAHGDTALADPGIVRQLAAERAGNALMVKPGQAVTLTAAEAAIREARAVGWGAILSARTGEAADGALVHMAVAWGAGQLAAGGLARGERIAIWNEALRVADALPGGAATPAADSFPWG